MARTQWSKIRKKKTFICACTRRWWFNGQLPGLVLDTKMTSGWILCDDRRSVALISLFVCLSYDESNQESDPVRLPVTCLFKKKPKPTKKSKYTLKAYQTKAFYTYIFGE